MPFQRKISSEEIFNDHKDFVCYSFNVSPPAQTSAAAAAAVAAAQKEEVSGADHAAFVDDAEAADADVQPVAAAAAAASDTSAETSVCPSAVLECAGSGADGGAAAGAEAGAVDSLKDALTCRSLAFWDWRFPELDMRHTEPRSPTGTRTLERRRRGKRNETKNAFIKVDFQLIRKPWY